MTGAVGAIEQVRRRRRQPERQLQVSLIAHLGWRLPADVFWWHHPAGGKRPAITGALLKNLGARRGIPDLLILAQGRLFGLELKSATGRLSPEQIDTHEQMRRAGCVIGVANDIDGAVDILGEWGVLK
jgi:hypothetical protein